MSTKLTLSESILLTGVVGGVPELEELVELDDETALEDEKLLDELAEVDLLEDELEDVVCDLLEVVGGGGGGVNVDVVFGGAS